MFNKMIATHDLPIVEGSYRLIEKYNVPADKYEFQMLYGGNSRPQKVNHG